ncbi:glycoside hydrolase family 2 [Saccharibacillus sp. O16]|nr:glycoside hydrolase family 2 [Saccharibacillus sp. O16]
MRSVYSLNGEWDFMPIYDDPMCRKLPEELVYEKRKVRVPSSWRISYPQPNGLTFGRIPEYDYAPYDLHDYPPQWDRAEAGVLHRTFHVPQEMAGQRIVLRLDGIMQKAVIYLDGEQIAIWEDGYLPLRVELGGRARPGEQHELHVVCGGFDRTVLENGQSKLTGLMGSWYGRIARGIWQDIALESYSPFTLENVGLRTSVRGGTLKAEVLLGTTEEEGTWSMDPERALACTVRLTIREKGILRHTEKQDTGREASEESAWNGSASYTGLSNESLLNESVSNELPSNGGVSHPHPSNPSVWNEDDPEDSDAAIPISPSFTSAPTFRVQELNVQESVMTGHMDSCSSDLRSPSKFDDLAVVMTAQRPLQSVDVSVSGVEPLRLCEGEHRGTVYRANWELNWSDAELWSPDSPFLYEAEFELLEGDQILDRLTETFGFREFWCEGPNFVLNGIPINLRGDSWHFQGEIQQTDEYVRNWYRMCRDVGVNVIRLHAEPHPESYLRIADEEGMLIVDETAIYGSSGVMHADHPDYLAACLSHVRRLARRDRNHPSIILWSVQNEMRWVVGRDGFKAQIPILMDAIRALDPTRPILVEGDNRLVSKGDTEVESRHYNIDGTIDQWDRSVPLTFGEHGGWWYICPQNSSPYIGLDAYRGTDESTLGLAIGERWFVEYARRSGVAGISTFNFAHYFMRAMPDEDILLSASDDKQPGSGLSGEDLVERYGNGSLAESERNADEGAATDTDTTAEIEDKTEAGFPGVRPDKIPAYSLTLNNGLLPESYPAYRPNPAFAVLKEAFRPVTMIAAEYNRCFYDHERIMRSFDVYNDTLQAHRVRIEIVIRQGEEVLREELLEFTQQPAERRVVKLNWMPLRTTSDEQASLSAIMFHDGKPVHEGHWDYRIVSANVRQTPIAIERKAVYWGGREEGSGSTGHQGYPGSPLEAYRWIRQLLPDCERIEQSALSSLPGSSLLIVGSHLPDPGDEAEKALADFIDRGGHVLLLEQSQWSPGGLVLSHRPFLRAHGGDYSHPVLEGLGDHDLICWQEEMREQGPLPIIQAAYEKPVSGDLTLLLECGAGDFGDGGDLWTPLLEYRSGKGLLLANQLELMAHLEQAPQAALLLRGLLAYAGRMGAGVNLAGAAAEAAPAPAAVLTVDGGPAAAFLAKLRLRAAAYEAAAQPAGSAPDSAPMPPAQGNPGFGLLVAEAAALEAPGTIEAVRRHAQAGGRVLVLPAQPGSEQQALARLLGRHVSITAHETYHLEAEGAAAVRGFSPVDLFGFDKPFLSPRETVNRPLAQHRIQVEGAEVLCRSIEGTAWKDYFVKEYTAEYSRLALVELNRRTAREPGAFVIEVPLGAGSIICSQLFIEPDSDKALRLYARICANLGASLDDGLLNASDEKAKWAVETVMALPCAPHVDYEAMKTYYIDPEFSLNNLGEGLYGWMKKRERRREDGMLRILAEDQEPWFVSVFIEVPEAAEQAVEATSEETSQGSLKPGTEGKGRVGRLGLRTRHVQRFELYLNGALVEQPEQELNLQSGLNRLIIIAQGEKGPFEMGLNLLHEDGRPMKDLAYRLTLDEVEPK